MPIEAACAMQVALSAQKRPYEAQKRPYVDTIFKETIRYRTGEPFRYEDHIAIFLDQVSYIPGLSTIGGVYRAFLAAAEVIAGVGLSIIYILGVLFGDSKENCKNLAKSVVLIARGVVDGVRAVVELIPFLGNLVLYMVDGIGGKELSNKCDRWIMSEKEPQAAVAYRKEAEPARVEEPALLLQQPEGEVEEPVLAERRHQTRSVAIVLAGTTYKVLTYIPNKVIEGAQVIITQQTWVKDAAFEKWEEARRRCSDLWEVLRA